MASADEKGLQGLTVAIVSSLVGSCMTFAFVIINLVAIDSILIRQVTQWIVNID